MTTAITAESIMGWQQNAANHIGNLDGATVIVYGRVAETLLGAENPISRFIAKITEISGLAQLLGHDPVGLVAQKAAKGIESIDPHAMSKSTQNLMKASGGVMSQITHALHQMEPLLQNAASTLTHAVGEESRAGQLIRQLARIPTRE